MKRKTLLLLGALTFVALGCNVQTPGPASTDKKQSQETEKALDEAFREVGLPDITRFTELRLARDIMEIRDDELVTHTYLFSLDGTLIYLGPSIGYGLPYAAQFTNPEKVLIEKNGYDAGDVPYTVPQAEMNGLYMPANADATWVVMVGPEGENRTVYIEPDVIVSPFKLTPEEVPPGTKFILPEKMENKVSPGSPAGAKK